MMSMELFWRVSITIRLKHDRLRKARRLARIIPDNETVGARSFHQNNTHRNEQPRTYSYENCVLRSYNRSMGLHMLYRLTHKKTWQVKCCFSVCPLAVKRWMCNPSSCQSKSHVLLTLHRPEEEHGWLRVDLCWYRASNRACRKQRGMKMRHAAGRDAFQTIIKGPRRIWPTPTPVGI